MTIRFAFHISLSASKKRKIKCTRCNTCFSPDTVVHVYVLLTFLTHFSKFVSVCCRSAGSSFRHSENLFYEHQVQKIYVRFEIKQKREKFFLSISSFYTLSARLNYIGDIELKFLLRIFLHFS